MPKVIGRVITAAPVPWTLKKLPLGLTLKTGPPWMTNPAALSGPQLKACIALATVATSAYGTRGKLPYKGVAMPAIAVKVAASPEVKKGEKVYGGMSRKERAELAHGMASTRIATLRMMLEAKA